MTQTHSDTLKSRILEIARELLRKHEEDIESGIEDRTYDKKENKGTRAFIAEAKAKFDEFENHQPAVDVINTDKDEPIKTAITSYIDGRTIIVYKDGGIKIFNQGKDWDSTANVTNIEPHEMELLTTSWAQGQTIANIEPDEMKAIIEALKAP